MKRKHTATQLEIRWPEPEDFKLETPIEVDADPSKSESSKEESVMQPALFD